MSIHVKGYRPLNANGAVTVEERGRFEETPPSDIFWLPKGRIDDGKAFVKDLVRLLGIYPPVSRTSLGLAVTERSRA
jgi:hypothetical protein